MRYKELTEVRLDDHFTRNKEDRYIYRVDFPHPIIPGEKEKNFPKGKKGYSNIKISIGIIDASKFMSSLPEGVIYNFGYTILEDDFTPTGRLRSVYRFGDGGMDRGKIHRRLTPNMREQTKLNLYEAVEDVMQKTNVPIILRGPLTSVKVNLPRYTTITKIIEKKYPVFTEIDGAHGFIWLHSKHVVPEVYQEKLKDWAI